MESMTNAPYLAQGARGGFRYGNTELADAIIKDGLWCAFDACLMGLGTERYVGDGITREQQDEVAMKSNERAANAIKAGFFAEEIVPVSIPQRKGEPILVDTDEGVRPGTTMESLSTLKPAFDKAGTITAANASQISDGGSAVVMMSEKALNARGVTPLGQVVSYGMVAGPDNASLLHQPSRAILKALSRAGLSVSDVDLFEINEAFAAVGIASMAELGIGDEIVNVNGGAIALGHPIGMSGNRLALTVLHELRRRGGGTGAVALCGGGGQGDALVVRTV
jgi:acetyl-CoA C-acetyltransferase